MSESKHGQLQVQPEQRTPSGNQANKRRKKKLILPRVQLRLIATFALVAVVALVLQTMLFARDLAQASDAQGGPLLESGLEALTGSLTISLLVLLPLVTLIGVAATFRLAGPLYKIQAFLEKVRDGESPPDCCLRESDQLQDLCALVNEVTRAGRGRASTTEKPGVSDRPKKIRSVA